MADRDQCEGLRVLQRSPFPLTYPLLLEGKLFGAVAHWLVCTIEGVIRPAPLIDLTPGLVL